MKYNKLKNFLTTFFRDFFHTILKGVPRRNILVNEIIDVGTHLDKKTTEL